VTPEYEKMSDDERAAYDEAVRLIEEARERGTIELDLSSHKETNTFLKNLTVLPPTISSLEKLRLIAFPSTRVSDLTPLANMNELLGISAFNTQINDLTPLKGLKNLRMLFIDGTQVTDIGPLESLESLRRIYCNDLPIKELPALHNMSKLETLALKNTLISDLRPILRAPSLSKLSFNDTPFAAANQTLTELAKLGTDEGNGEKECAAQTIAYLKTLPPWPEPLPWEAERKPPTQEQALPLTLSKDNKVQVVSPTPKGEEANDPVKEAVLDELLALINDLIRVAGNKHDDIYRAAQSLKGRIDKPLSEIEMLKTHMAIEGLKRILSNKSTRSGYDALDSGCTTALQAVIETGPALTLDNPQVNVFIERQTRNQLRLLEEAQTAASIALAEAIRDGEDQFEDEVRQIAASGAAPQSGDQLTNASPWLNRNSVIVIGGWFAMELASNAVGVGLSSFTKWLVANEAVILTQAHVWGQPFVAWISPILAQAREARAAALAITDKRK
jgi:internalin A